MHDKEALEMMIRCKNEIEILRNQISVLKPKADAYDAITQVLGLLPRPSQGRGEDVVWIIERESRKISDKLTSEKSDLDGL